MPSLPQILHGTRFIGRIEINRQLDIEHFSQTDCHIAVTAEIKINLKGISQYHQKRGGGVQKGSLLETVIYGKRKHICKQHLFSQTDCKNHDALCKIIRLKAAVLLILKLRHHFLIGHNGACNQLGKEGHKGKIIDKGVMLRPSGASVNNKGKLLKSKKADSKG